MATGYTFAPFRVDLGDERLWRGTTLLQVRPKTFAMLAYLLEHPDRLVTHEELHRNVWGHCHVSESLLRGYIRELRQVLGDNAATPAFIETVPRRGYRFIAPVTAVQAAAAGAPMPEVCESPAPGLVGRERERAALHACLERCLGGARQIVFITGEPGIGKTVLLDSFLSECQRVPGAVVAFGQCIELYGQGEPYLPLLQALDTICRDGYHNRLPELLAEHAPSWLMQLGGLVTETQRSALQQRTAGTTQARMLRELVTVLEVIARSTLLVVALEDLQWSDYSTVDLVSLLARGRAPARLLLVGTYRHISARRRSGHGAPHPPRRARTRQARQLHGAPPGWPGPRRREAASRTPVCGSCPGRDPG